MKVTLFYLKFWINVEHEQCLKFLLFSDIIFANELPNELDIDQIFERESCDDLQRILANEEEKEQLEKFLSTTETSKLFEIKDDAFAKMIIENIEPRIWKIKSKNAGREENLLHFFINQKFYASIAALLAANDPHVNELVFEQNKAGNTPLMSSLTQKDEKLEEVKRQSWTVMKRDRNSERITPASKVLNQRKESILHLCAQTGEHKGLLKILKAIDPSQVQEIVFQQSGEGKTILDMCKDEHTVIQILEMLNLSKAEESDLKYCDNRDRNLFNNWARVNHHGAIYHLQKNTSKETFREMILKRSKNGNNPMMVAALHNNKETLDMFLFHVGLHQSLYKEDIDGILHDEDKYGDTLLALVIQQSGRLDAARCILLDMEKKLHCAESEGGSDVPGQRRTTEEGKRDLTRCLRRYLKPSKEAQKALEEVEHSLPKTTFQKILIWTKVFLKSLFIPVLVLFLDIFFDSILVYQYHGEDDDKYETQYQICRGLISTNFTLIEARSSSTMPFVCSPLALDKVSRFNYSLAFVISPWILYYIEYGQSDHWQASSKVTMIIEHQPIVINPTFSRGSSSYEVDMGSFLSPSSARCCSAWQKVPAWF